MTGDQQPTDPDELRREIAATRADMDRTLAQLEDQVSPRRITQRQTARARSRMQGAREAVMGTAQQAGARGSQAADQAQGRLRDAQQAATEAPQRAEETTRGNPLAAGLVVFGVGALAGSLLPPTPPEQRAAEELRDRFEEPVKDSLRQSGEEVRDQIQEHAQEAAEQTRQTAQESAERVRGETRESAEQVQGQARGAAQTVRSQS